ncbi:MAG: hypothetical protein K2W96_16435 [Gemmataceae bacterium]|nr:hypothetical protein [Gemmataceae bacterium]
MRRATAWTILPFLLAPLPASGADEVPKEVRALAGSYAGSWTMFGIDGKGEVVKKMAWTDTVKAERPEVKDGRAQVAVSGEMAFEGGKPPPFRFKGKEGYLLKKGGGLGDYFTEMAGETRVMAKLGEGTWAGASEASEADLMRLGFPKGATGTHVMVKAVGEEKGVETHRITRLTTARWKDKDGKERVLQFTSMKGHHTRQPRDER